MYCFTMALANMNQCRDAGHFKYGVLVYRNRPEQKDANGIRTMGKVKQHFKNQESKTLKALT